jgi:TRAP-type C4-dicarboxylate transport system substrate-binding protein
VGREALFGLDLLAGVAPAAALAVGACDGGDTQRAGGEPAGPTKVLKLANANPSTDELQLFIDQVEKVSDGRLRIEPVNDWRKGETRYEMGLIQDVKAGKADLGWVGSRALAGVGVRSFEPLHAPFFIDSYELQDQVLEGDADERMLADLERIGLAGVAVLPGPLQYLQLDREVDGPAGIAGLSIGYYDSPLQRDALTALGAEPAAIPTGGSISNLNGVGVHVVAIHGNGYVNTAKYTVANAPLWPRPFVVFANSETWTSLPEVDRDLIVQAAEQARAGWLVALLEREQTSIEGICKAGARMVNLGDDARARMQQAVKPLLAKLRNDPATRDAMAEIDSARAGGSPHSLRCPAGTGTQQATLTGVFETTIRKADKGSAVFGEFDEHGIDAIEFSLELSDGRAVITEYLPTGPITGFDYPYSIFKDVIKFDGTGLDLTARWELDGNRLRFTDVDGPPGDKFVWGRTWIKTD